MEKRKFPPCHVGYYYGSQMHTCKVNCIDDDVWIYRGCDESKIENNVKYKVWLTIHDAADPADQSTTTVVYHFEKIPKNILKIKEIVDSYWKSDEPLTKKGLQQISDELKNLI